MEKKYKDLLTIGLFYLISFTFAGLIVSVIHFDNIIFNVLFWDILSTIFIFIFSCFTNNSSVYDPYWSIVPGLVAIYLMVYYKAYSIWHIIALFGILLWSLRLTINWMSVTDGFNYEDWRYKMFKDKSRNKFEWFIYNFFGIHLVPTLFVFLGMIPMFSIFANEMSYLSIIGVLIMILGVALEYFADKDMHSFLKKETVRKKVCDYGLWSYSRHPNYLGEITFWVGLALTSLLSIKFNYFDLAGFIGMIFMFNVISIPMAEKRQISRRSDYKQYMNTTHRLLLLPHKHHR